MISRKSKKWNSFNILVSVIVLLMLLSTAGCKAKSQKAAAVPTNRQVTNQDGTVVTVPAVVDKVACLYGPSCEKVALLGGMDKVKFALNAVQIWTWVPVVYDNWENVNALSIQECGNPNIETLLENDIQVVFFWNRPDTIQKLQDAGIACIYPGNAASNSGDYLFDDAKNLLRVYAAALGEEEQKRAEEYCKYFDQKKAFVTERTKDIPDSERPSVYFAVRKSLQTAGRNSNVPELIRLAGGSCVSSELEAGFGYDIVIEQLLEWDPEYIILDHCGAPTLGSAPAEKILADISDDSRFDNIAAVKNNNVYMSPTGVFFWDEGQQMILQLIWLAQMLHPDTFKDIDMTVEVKDYYSRFYNYDLTDNEAQRILMHMPPE